MGNTRLQSTSMSKQSPDRASPLTSHRLKRTRRESPSPSAQLQDMQTPSQTQMFSDDELQDYHRKLQTWLIPKPKEEGMSRVLSLVYHYTAFTIIEMSGSGDSDRTVVQFDQFMKNVQEQGQFVETLRTAANFPVNRQALEALIFHSMCLCFRTNQVMNIIQVHSGLQLSLHLRMRVGLLLRSSPKHSLFGLRVGLLWARSTCVG